MTELSFSPHFVQAIREGNKQSTLRKAKDSKHLKKGDKLLLYDVEKRLQFGIALLVEIERHVLKDLPDDDLEDLMANYDPEELQPDTPVDKLSFDLVEN